MSWREYRIVVVVFVVIVLAGTLLLRTTIPKEWTLWGVLVASVILPGIVCRLLSRSPRNSWQQDRIKTALLHAGAAAGVYDKAMDDFVQRGLQVFNGLDDDGQPVSIKADGEYRYGKDGISPLRPEEWGLALKLIAPHLWPGSAGGGAPPHHGSGGQGIDWNAIKDPAERITRFRELQAIHKQ